MKQLLACQRLIQFFSLLLLLVLASCDSPSGLLNGGHSTSTQSSIDRGHLIYTMSDKSLRAFFSKKGVNAWKKDTSSTYRSFLVTKDTVYAVSDKLYAFDAVSGEDKWNQPIGENLSYSFNAVSNIATDNNNVYVVSNGIAFSFNAKKGTPQWRQPLQPPVDARGTADGGFGTSKAVIIVQSGMLYINNKDGSFVAALQTDHGKQLWSKQIPDDIDPGSFGASLYYQPVDDLILHNGVLYARTSTDVVALNKQSGAIIWQKIVGRVDSMTMTTDDMYISTKQNVVGAPQDGFYQLKLSNGTLNALQLPDGSVDFEHGYQDGNVYMIGGPTSGDVMAVQLSNNALMWRVESTGKIDFLDILNGNLYVVRDDGMISLLDRRSHKTIWSKSVPRGQGLNVQADQSAIYSASNGHVTAMDIQTGKTLWTVDTNGNLAPLTSNSNAPAVFISSN